MGNISKVKCDAVKCRNVAWYERKLFPITGGEFHARLCRKHMKEIDDDQTIELTHKNQFLDMIRNTAKHNKILKGEN